MEESTIEKVIGMDAISGQIALEETGYIVCIAEKDGQAFAVDCMYRDDRANLTIRDGKIIKAKVG
jgi:hypothetical protein